MFGYMYEGLMWALDISQLDVGQCHNTMLSVVGSLLPYCISAATTWPAELVLYVRNIEGTLCVAGGFSYVPSSDGFQCCINILQSIFRSYFGTLPW